MGEIVGIVVVAVVRSIDHCLVLDRDLVIEVAWAEAAEEVAREVAADRETAQRVVAVPARLGTEQAAGIAVRDQASLLRHPIHWLGALLHRLNHFYQQWEATSHPCRTKRSLRLHPRQWRRLL